KVQTVGNLNLENRNGTTNSITIDDSADPSNLQWVLGLPSANQNDAEGDTNRWGEVFGGSTVINYEYNDTSSLTLNTGGTGPGTSVEVLATNPDNLACQTHIVSNAPTTVQVGEGIYDVQSVGALNLENQLATDTITIDDSSDSMARKMVTLSTLKPG